MASPSYTTDLNTICLCETGDTFEEFTGYALGDNASLETDWYLQGNSCASDEANNKTGVGHSIGFDYGSDLAGSFGTGDCFFAWMMCMAPNAPDTYANGGYRVLIGSTTTNFDGWIVGGSDYGRNPLGGWTNVVVDPTHTADYTGGTGLGATYQHFAVAFNLQAGISKGRPICADAMRYGRGELIIEYGDLTNGYGTFAGIAIANDGSTARWGLFQEQFGGYLWKGLMSFGNATNACDFRDSDRFISIDDTPKTYAGFNAIEINNASSRVDWTNITFTSLGTYSKGVFSMEDNADVNIDGCTFIDMNTFTFLSNGACTNSIFIGCGIITAGDADFSGTSISGYEGTADTSPFVWDVATDPNNDTDGMSFTKGTASTHAIEFGTSSPLTINLSNIAFSGYNASDAQTDSTLHVKRTTGTVNIYVSGCTGNISYKSAGATVNIIADPVTIAVNVVDTDGNDMENARVFLKASDGTGPFPFEDTVTISNSGTTATVTHTAHGMATGDYINIDLSGSGSEVSHYQNDGTFQITKINDNSYSYVMGSAPGSSPTGTIKATFVALFGLTDVNGEKSTTRVYSSDQPVEGWARITPTYKTARLFGTVDDVNGFTATGVLIDD